MYGCPLAIDVSTVLRNRRSKSSTYRSPARISKVRNRATPRSAIRWVPTLVILASVCSEAREYEQSFSTTVQWLLTLDGKQNALGRSVFHGLHGSHCSRMIASGQLAPCVPPAHRSHWETRRPSTFGEKGSSVAL